MQNGHKEMAQVLSLFLGAVRAKINVINFNLLLDVERKKKVLDFDPEMMFWLLSEPHWEETPLSRSHGSSSHIMHLKGEYTPCILMNIDLKDGFEKTHNNLRLRRPH